MAENIEFYFDFSSPYGYLASHRIEDIAAKHGRGVDWKAFLMGAVFKINGERPLVEQPLKGEYSLMDLKRVAREWDIPFQLPDPFPIPTIAAARVFYRLARDDAGAATGFAKAALHAYFALGTDIRAAQTVVEIAAPFAESAGIGGDTLAADIASQDIKDEVRQVTDEAISRGVCGSPYVFVDGEAFWGSDRLAMVDRWLASGGW